MLLSLMTYIFQAGDALIQLYHKFISDFESKINHLKLAHFADTVSRQYSDVEVAIHFSVDEMLQTSLSLNR